MIDFELCSNCYNCLYYPTCVSCVRLAAIRRSNLVTDVLRRHPLSLPTWFARIYSEANPDHATQNAQWALEQCLLKRLEFVLLVPSIGRMGDEIYIRDFAPTDRQLRELGNCIDISYGYSAENLATHFATEINCEIAAIAGGWLIYSETVRDEKLVQKFSELVNFCKYKNSCTVDKYKGKSQKDRAETGKNTRQPFWSR